MVVNNHVKVIDWRVSWQGHPFTSKLHSTRLFVNGPVQELFIEIPNEAGNFNPPYCVVNHKIARVPDRLILWWCKFNLIEKNGGPHRHGLACSCRV